MKKDDRRRRLRAVRALAAAAVVASVAIAASADNDGSEAAVRERFRAAYAAAALGIETADDDALRAYVLYPYLRAARLERGLARAQGAWADPDVATAELLKEAGDAPIALLLRRSWLQSLARRELWQSFLEQYRVAATTSALECVELNARIALRRTTDLSADIRAKWLAGHRLPNECEPAFQWLRAQGELPSELVARRVELLLDNGHASFARVVAARLPAETSAPLLERALFIESPARMLDTYVRDASEEVPAAVVLEAWTRLARNAPEDANQRYRALFDRMPERADARAL